MTKSQSGNRAGGWRDWAAPAAVGVGVFGLVVLLVLFGQHQYEWSYWLSLRLPSITNTLTTAFQDFMTLSLGIIVEAFPFVVLGVLVALVIRYALPMDLVLKWLPKNRLVRRFCISFMGVALPVCECGNVPVVRSLIMRGFTVQESIVFLLAAPSINIVTFIVTWQAFRLDHEVAFARVGLTLVIANLMALAVTKFCKGQLLNAEFAATCEAGRHDTRSLGAVLATFRSELWLITRMLCLGAVIAGATQAFVPREIIASIASNVFLSVVAMLLLAFIISICSTVDAFFALAYASTFNLGAIVAFLVAGPMVDIKMLALMKTTYTIRVLAVITAGVLLLSLIAGVGLSYVW